MTGEKRREGMNTGFTMSYYGLSAVLLAVSYHKDRKKTKMAVKRALLMMKGVLPYFLAILMCTGAVLLVLTPGTIHGFLGTGTGFGGILLSAAAGAVTLVPVLAVFPVVSELLKNGAGTAQMAAFISALTTVGLVTLPLETKYLGIRAAVLRNLFFFLFSLLTALILEAVL